MHLLRLLLLIIALPAAAPGQGAANPQPSATALPAIDQLRHDLSQSKAGFALTLQNARYYAGWIPRGFITAMLNLRPQFLPGAPLDKQTWRDGPYFREGLYFRPGITDWGARHIAERYDQRQALEAANQDYSGTAEIGFGRFLGAAFDPMLILLVVLLAAWVRRLAHRRHLKRQEIKAMAEAHQKAGVHPLSPPPPTAPPHQTEGGPSPFTAPPTDSPAPATEADVPEFHPPPPPAGPAVGPPVERMAPPPPPPPPPPPERTENTERPAEKTVTSGPEDDLFTAFQACRAWAEKGSTDDQFQLANLYRQGHGVAASQEQASHWYRKAAEAGHAQAQYELARRLFHGIGILPDEHAAALWMQQAAQQGLADAKLNLATLYARGLGLATEPAQALHWLQSGAQDGDADAADLLASAYRFGWLGLPADPQQADHWQQRAGGGPSPDVS